MKNLILEKISEYGDVSFADIQRIDKSQGDMTLFYGPAEDNCVLWSNLSETVCTAIKDLQKEGLIEYKRLPSILIYVIDGTLLELPIAKRIKKYKKLHWLPVILVRKEVKK